MTKVLRVATKRTVVLSPSTTKKTVVLSPSTTKTVLKVGNVVPSSVNAYTHIQSSPSTTWTITHNLGYNPGGVSVVDSAGSKMYGDVTYVNTNQIVVNFSAGFSGKAYIS